MEPYAYVLRQALTPGEWALWVEAGGIWALAGAVLLLALFHRPRRP
jgi:hypothetical protein